MEELEKYQDIELGKQTLELFVFSTNNENNYQWFVEAGRNILKGMVVHQAVLGFYASKICTIRHGGRSDGYYTIKDYAEDLGINPKTLNDWTAIYRRVIQHLNLDPLKMSVHEWKAARRIAYGLEYSIQNKNNEDDKKRRKNKLFPDKEKIQKLYEENLEGPSFFLESSNWASYFQTIQKNVQKRDLSLANRTTLIQIMSACDFISDFINDYLTENKGN